MRPYLYIYVLVSVRPSDITYTYSKLAERLLRHRALFLSKIYNKVFFLETENSPYAANDGIDDGPGE